MEEGGCCSTMRTVRVPSSSADSLSRIFQSLLVSLQPPSEMLGLDSNEATPEEPLALQSSFSSILDSFHPPESFLRDFKSHLQNSTMSPYSMTCSALKQILLSLSHPESLSSILPPLLYFWTLLPFQIHIPQKQTLVDPFQLQLESTLTWSQSTTFNTKNWHLWTHKFSPLFGGVLIMSKLEMFTF